MTDTSEETPAPPSIAWKKIVVIVAVLIIGGIGYTQFGEYLTLDYLSTKEAALRQYQQDHPLLVIVLGLLIYAIVTGLSLPGAAFLTLAYGWYFGFWKGLLVVSFASTLGATLALLLSRFLLRDLIQAKFGDRLQSFNDALEKEGAFYLFTLRLIPVVPFVVINLVMGLTPIKVWTYWWVSQLGMLAGTAVYVYAGSQFPTLLELKEKGASGILTPQLLIAFILLGIFPIVVKKAVGRFGRTEPSDAKEEAA